MKTRSHGAAGITWTETLLAIVIVVSLLGALSTSWHHHIVPTSRIFDMQTLSNMKILHSATQKMALDGTATGNTNLGWPGDIGGHFSPWASQLMTGGYLSADELKKTLAPPGRPYKDMPVPTANTNAVLLYAVSESSSGDTVFLSTGNFTNTPTGGSLDRASGGTNGFAVFRKGGDGSYLYPKQIGRGFTNLIGASAPLCR